MDKWKVCDQTMNQSEKILEIKDLCVEFKTVEGTVKAINHLNYTLHKGEKLGIVGESGSGKSVSSLGIMQLIPNPPGEIVGGEILYKGQDLVKKSEKDMQKIRGNEISMIFQEPMTSLNPIIKCGRQIAESLRLHRGMNKKEAMEEAIRMMQAVGIANPEVRAHEYPHQMSGGMRQRVMIAMALACQPQILIADEPTTALDVTIQAQILDLIRGLNEQMNTSVLFITHDLGVVSELCDTVIVMYTGRIVEKAPVRELFNDPKHPYTVGLMSAIPRITKDRPPLETIEGVVPNPTEQISGCLARCYPATIELAVFAIILATLFGILFGVISAIKRNSIIDQIVRAISVTGVSLPSFWFALLVLYFFYYKLQILPGPGRLGNAFSAPQTVTGFFVIDSLLEGDIPKALDALRHLILPGTVLAAFTMGLITRTTRSNLLDVMSTDYIRTARAKGLSNVRLIIHHALGNALIPVLTVIGLGFGNLLGGMVLVETIFNWPGVGQFAYQSVLSNDYPSIIGVALLIALNYMIINTVVDILYGIIDPRVRCS